MLALQCIVYLAAACSEGTQQALPCPALVLLVFLLGTPYFAAAYCAKQHMPFAAGSASTRYTLQLPVQCLQCLASPCTMPSTPA